jgi:hypothetical protein
MMKFLRKEAEESVFVAKKGQESAVREATVDLSQASEPKSQAEEKVLFLGDKPDEAGFFFAPRGDY